MFINLRPLLKYRDYRLLFLSQVISFLGSMITYVAIPYQVYALTKSSLDVGLLGTVQLLPILIFGVVGGTVADILERRKLILIAEGFMGLGALALAVNATLAEPSIAAIFVIAFFMQVANGFHRPAMDAMTQKLVDPSDYGAVSALGSLRHSGGAIVGPALGGILIASLGPAAAYFIDCATFVIAVVLISLVGAMPPVEANQKLTKEALLFGLRYARKRPELMGTYIVDIVAMAFAFPTALFPAMAEQWGGPKAAGALYSAMSVGSLLMTVLSGWTHKVSRHGKMVVIAATLWAVAIVGLGHAPTLALAVVALGFAGAADMVSGLFRGIIWNETIPNEIRGRLSGIEMISYMSGPLIGNVRAGWMAGWSSTAFSIIAGGWICVVCVILSAVFLPSFWKYRSPCRAPHLP